MRLGPRLRRPPLVLVSVLAGLVAPALSGCGLFDRGSDVDEAFEYLPADTFQVRFTEGGIADQLDISEIGRYATLMDDAPFNADDIDWEAWASWGDPEKPDGAAAVWKVDDDTDLAAFADDLEEQGYDKEDVDGRSLFSIDLSASDDGTVGGIYPVPLLLNVLIDEDEQVVAGARDVGSLDDVAAVIGDDDDSLADDDGFEDLLGAADDDPDIAWLTNAGATVCTGTEARALFVSGDEEEVRLVLQYDDESAAEDDLEAREALVEDGVDPVTREAFADLGEFELEQDGDLVLVDEDFDGGAQVALRAEQKGGGPGACVSRA